MGGRSGICLDAAVVLLPDRICVNIRSVLSDYQNDAALARSPTIALLPAEAALLRVHPIHPSREGICQNPNRSWIVLRSKNSIVSILDFICVKGQRSFQVPVSRADLINLLTSYAIKSAHWSGVEA